LLTVAIGSWLVGASPLAGPWLPTAHRRLGAVSGLGFIAFGLGLLVGGVDHPLYIAGAVGYLIAFPIWALLMGRLFARIDETRGIERQPQPV
jgi:biotin transporter BioY